MPKVFSINGRFLAQPVTGVQRYAIELLSALDILLETPRYAKMPLECLVPPETTSMPALRNIPVRQMGRLHGNLCEQCDLPGLARGKFLFSPANIGPAFYRNQALTFHDASVFAIPQAYSTAFRLKYRFVFRSLARRAALLFTDSQFSQHELAKYLKVHPQAFKVIPLGSEHITNIQANTRILEQAALKRGGYILTVASHSLHKNFRVVIEAARQLKNLKFVAVGGSFSSVFQNNAPLAPPPNVRILGYVNDTELKALYENALGFVLPSLYEGFGLPVLEAMRCGCPVICSKAASLPEVAGDAALYFNPEKVAELVDVIAHFVSNPQAQERLRRLGYEQAAGFTWEKTAQMVLENLAGLL